MQHDAHAWGLTPPAAGTGARKRRSQKRGGGFSLWACAERLWAGDGLAGRTRISQRGACERLYGHGRQREQRLQEERRQRYVFKIPFLLFSSC